MLFLERIFGRRIEHPPVSQADVFSEVFIQENKKVFQEILFALRQAQHHLEVLTFTHQNLVGAAHNLLENGRIKKSVLRVKNNQRYRDLQILSDQAGLNICVATRAIKNPNARKILNSFQFSLSNELCIFSNGQMLKPNGNSSPEFSLEKQAEIFLSISSGSDIR